MTKERQQKEGDMKYAYKVVEGKVFVTPIVYACTQCPFKTTDQRAEQEHYYGAGHYSKTTTPAELTEEWDETKHGPLPSWVRRVRV